jgi:thioredoxin-related protein
MKISVMKTGLLVICSLLFLGSLQAQVAASTQLPEAPYLKNPTLPPFKLIEVDSVHFLTNANIKKNREVLIMFFSPDCEHRKHQTRDILESIAKFKDIEIVMATFQPFNEMTNFYAVYRIGDYHNIYMGRDEHYLLPTYYRMQSLPFLALYDKKGQLITHFEGNQKVETLLNAFQGKDK